MTKFERKQRRERRKTIILAVAFVLAVCQALWVSSHYTKSGMVWETNGNSVTVKLADGEMYSYYTDNPPARFEKVNVVFDTNGTEDRYDDKVVGVR